MESSPCRMKRRRRRQMTTSLSREDEDLSGYESARVAVAAGIGRLRDMMNIGTDGSEEEQRFQSLVSAIQIAVLKAFGCIVVLSYLAWYALQTFLPVLSPLLLAAGVSIVTHPSVYRASYGGFRKRHQELLQRYATTSKSKAAIAVHDFFLKLILSLRVWGQLPEWFAHVTGISLFSRWVLGNNEQVSHRIGLIIMTACGGYFYSMGLMLIGFAVFIVGTTCMVVLEADRSVTVVIFFSTSAVLIAAGTFVCSHLASEVLVLVEVTKSGVSNAGEMISDEQAKNKTDIAVSYAYEGLVMLAESQNISTSALFEIAYMLQNNTKEMRLLFEPERYQEAVQAIGGDSAFWLDLSKQFGSGGVVVTTWLFGAATMVTGAATGIMWFFWQFSIFVLSVFALNKTQHTLMYNVLSLIMTEQAADIAERQLASNLSAILRSIMQLFLYHFALTLFILQRFKIAFPYTGALVAGLIALFPYFPKYYIVPLPSILFHYRQLFLTPNPDYDFFDDDFSWIFLWILIPCVVGDEWIFADVVKQSGGADPKMTVLSFVMGFYVWGYTGVVTGPLLFTAGVIFTNYNRTSATATVNKDKDA
eukprot:TRINITY_DN1845_c0_g2_i1.p1 TRINITY_DN1845_c0_g2~~TRINITY_DN1845_c0_g2_i1.p1  ORF type:complete len:589 (+),score=95.07 TRINITY_DN1845_c0_g2_i1:3276-5042(+)